jgi:hypothetical protein
MKQTLILSSVIAFALTLTLGCGSTLVAAVERPQAGEEATVPEKPVEEIPCFEHADGKLLFRIEGVPVHEGTLNHFASIFEKRHPKASRSATLRRAIEDGLIPQAAMYAAHRSEMPALSRRAAVAMEKLRAGTSFRDVVISESDDPNRSITGGSEGVRRRLAVPGLQPPSPALEDRGFSIQPKTFSEPFVTPLGVEIVYVESEVPSQDPSHPDAVQRELFRILFSFNAEYGQFIRHYDRADPSSEGKLKAYKAAAKKRIDSARVEVVEKEYSQYFYPFRIKK